MILLSKRLQTIADRVTQGARVADIGSDHALLPVYLVSSGKCPSAIAGELNAGPFEAARRQTAEAGLKERISVRRGDGLSVLEPGEADTVTIAGMGGSLMAGILEAGWSAGKLEGVRELVLQPNVGEDIVRRWLSRRGYALAGEAILEEDGHCYEVLAARLSDHIAEWDERLYNPAFLNLPMTEEEGRNWLYRMGPHLLRDEDGLLARKWRLELAKLERICKQISRSDSADAAEKSEAFRKEMRQIEEVLACWQTVKPSYN